MAYCGSCVANATCFIFAIVILALYYIMWDQLWELSDAVAYQGPLTGVVIILGVGAGSIVLCFLWQAGRDVLSYLKRLGLIQRSAAQLDRKYKCYTR